MKPGSIQALENARPTEPPPVPPAAPRPEFWSVTTVRAVLEQRGLVLALFGAAALYFGGSFLLGRAVYRCPFHAATGYPCPGCGMSRALTLLAVGRWREALGLHPFAPYLMVWAVMLAGAALLPARRRGRWATGWAVLEARTRFHAVLLTAFAVFGIARLLWSLWWPA